MDAKEYANSAQAATEKIRTEKRGTKGTKKKGKGIELSHRSDEMTFDARIQGVMPSIAKEGIESVIPKNCPESILGTGIPMAATPDSLWIALLLLLQQANASGDDSSLKRICARLTIHSYTNDEPASVEDFVAECRRVVEHYWKVKGVTPDKPSEEYELHASSLVILVEDRLRQFFELYGAGKKEGAILAMSVLVDHVKELQFLEISHHFKQQASAGKARDSREENESDENRKSSRLIAKISSLLLRMRPHSPLLKVVPSSKLLRTLQRFTPRRR